MIRDNISQATLRGHIVARTVRSSSYQLGQPWCGPICTIYKHWLWERRCVRYGPVWAVRMGYNKRDTANCPPASAYTTTMLLQPGSDMCVSTTTAPCRTLLRSAWPVYWLTRRRLLWVDSEAPSVKLGVGTLGVIEEAILSLAYIQHRTELNVHSCGLLVAVKSRLIESSCWTAIRLSAAWLSYISLYISPRFGGHWSANLRQRRHVLCIPHTGRPASWSLMFFDKVGLAY